jgi:hypothetical protein|tara:strand:- start:482 stop:742 length:261 start_codon:yes stop_codon:yes gene_type:complete
MPRRKRNKGINLKGMRRKCSATGKIAQVEHILIELPPSNRAFNPKETKKAIDTKGAVVKYYSSTDVAPGGKDEWYNNYKEEDFYKL